MTEASPKLIAVSQIAEQFQKAILRKIDSDPKFLEQLVSVVSPEEWKQLGNMVQDIEIDASMGALHAGWTMKLQEHHEANLRATDKTVEFLQRVLNKKQLAAFIADVVPELKTRENIAVLKQHHAPRLAALSR